MAAETNPGSSESRTQSTASGVKPKLGEMAEPLKEIAEPLKEKAEQLAEQQKQTGTSQARKLASAVHTAARELEGEMPKVANTVHNAARRLEETADNLRNKNVDELIQSFDRYAREQPAVVFGGAVLAGILLSRFLKSSASPGSTASSQSYAPSYESES